MKTIEFNRKASQNNPDIDRQKFTDSIADLYPMVVTKGHLVFDEPEPIHKRGLACYATGHGQVTKAYHEVDKWWKEWEQRRDNFEPLIIQGPEAVQLNRTPESLWNLITEMGCSDFTVEDALKMGFTLNPKHELYPENFNEVNAFEL